MKYYLLGASNPETIRMIRAVRSVDEGFEFAGMLDNDVKKHGADFYGLAVLGGIEKIHFTGNLSNAVLLFIILAIVLYSLLNEKIFKLNQTNIFDSFVNGAKDGFTTGVRVLPYMIAMLVALSIFRNSGMMEIIMKKK